ncbi:glycosyltransferase [Pectinatus haikarae]|uniref:glycosyltransferase n=1 Tax=Pectinatus haikarae TaxID=349096 RepID=UPI0018C540DC|nr:glycosyltransferase [Pectinatus haikarae]
MHKKNDAEKTDDFWDKCMEMLYMEDEKKKILKKLIEDITVQSVSAAPQSRPYRLLINLLEKENTDAVFIKRAIEAAIRDFPELPDFTAEYANILAAEYEFVKAVKFMKRAFILKKTYRGKERSLFENDNYDIAKISLRKWQNVIALAAKIRISACVIVKNEEKNIQYYLDNIRKYTDEQIVVDTGSTDNTLSLLSDMAVTPYHYKWQDDFAAAKNFAVDKANGDWIVFLDADEYFTDTASKLHMIIAQEEISSVIPDAIMCVKVNIEKSTGNEINRFCDLCIFRNLSHLRYHGKIHEQLRNSKTDLTVRQNDSLCIYHTGYSANLRKEKAERNLKLLLNQKYDEKEPIPWHYLADCYYGMEDFEKAVFCTEHYFSQDRYKVINMESSVWRNYINALFILKKPFMQIKKVIDSAIEKFPDIADFYAFAGYIYFQQNKYIQAENKFLQAKSIYMKNKHIGMTSTAFAADQIQIDKYMSEIQRAKKELFISACVIVKNNEKEIKTWLNCVKLFSDEIIVIDTGCEDSTIDILKDSDVAVYPYTWQNDFAAAKNYALDKAQGKWIVFLDADEYFSENTVRHLKYILENLGDMIDTVTCKMINIDTDNNNAEINSFFQTRIFINSRKIFYKGKIHEQLWKKDGSLQNISRKDMLIYHTGYSEKICTEKMKRNLDIMLDDIKHNGENIYYYKYLADCYAAFDDYEKAIFYYNKHLRTGLCSAGNESDIYFNLIDVMIKGRAHKQDVFPLVKTACEKFPQQPEFPAQFGALNFLLKNYDTAKKYLQTALDMQDRPEEIFTDNFTAIVPEVYRYLAYIFWKENNKEETFVCLDKSLSGYRYNYMALRLLIKLVNEMENEKAFGLVGKYYNNTIKDMLFISDQSFMAGNMKLFAYYNQILYEKHGIYSENWKAWNILMSNDKEKAFEELLARTVERIQLLVISLLNMGELPAKYQQILPEKIWNCLCAYYNQNELQGNDDYDAYLTLLPVVISRTEDDIYQKYVAMAVAFPREILVKVADILYNSEKWQELHIFLLKLIKEEDLPGEEYLFRMAQCLYYNKEFAEAEQFFKKSLADNYRLEEVKAYLKWIEERQIGKW